MALIVCTARTIKGVVVVVAVLGELGGPAMMRHQQQVF